MRITSVRETDDNKIIMTVECRIDSSNAQMFENELLQMLNPDDGKNLILDFENVDYISSSSLRVLFKLQKRTKKRYNIINLNSETEDIFRTTGFDEIFNVQKAMRRCRIDGCKMIRTGLNANVYRLDDDTLIKVFIHEVPLEAIRREQQMAHKLFFEGIPSCISYDTVRVGTNQYGNVYELLDKNTLAQVISENPTQFKKMMPKFTDLLRLIHETSGADLGLPRTKELYFNQLDQCSEWYTPDEINKMKAIVDSAPDRDTLVHGDFQPNNIMFEGNELILVDLGEISVGHPVFDFIATASTMINIPELNPKYAEEYTKLSAATLLKSWQMLLCDYFAEKTDRERQQIDRQLRLLSRLKTACAPADGKGRSDTMIRRSVEDVKQNLIPQTDELTGCIDW